MKRQKSLKKNEKKVLTNSERHDKMSELLKTTTQNTSKKHFEKKLKKVLDKMKTK